MALSTFSSRAAQLPNKKKFLVVLVLVLVLM